jgi:carbon dioxide concentrating mechanism protein CcmL
MIFGTVIGTVVSTRKSDTTEGTAYLLVQMCGRRGEPKDGYVVALDLVGAGKGEMVIVSRGSSSRQTDRTFEKPIDAVIVGIVDLVEETGRVVYRKSGGS